MSRDEVRECIDRLEVIKDFVEFFESAPIRDPATMGMWIGDAKEAFYEVVAAYNLLLGRGEGNDGSNALAFLEMAKSRIRQVSSELKTFNNPVADDLIVKFEDAFEKAAKAISDLAGPAPRGQGLGEAGKAITRLTDNHYVLNCSVCGKPATVFRTEIPRFSKAGEEVLFEGVTKSTHFNISNERAIFGLLEKGDLRGLNNFLGDLMEGGLDAYCPECDKLYCREEYDLEEEWDEGFYDDTYGTCPEGHRRLLDD